MLFDETLGGLACGKDAGVKQLPLTGTYVLTVRGEQSSAEAYAFQIWEAPPPQDFRINVGDILSANVPGPGAGDIESPGAVDRFTFTVEPWDKCVLRRAKWRLFLTIAMELP